MQSYQMGARHEVEGQLLPVQFAEPTEFEIRGTILGVPL